MIEVIGLFVGALITLFGVALVGNAAFSDRAQLGANNAAFSDRAQLGANVAVVGVVVMLGAVLELLFG